MPVITPYESQILPQGMKTAHATPNDFGAQVGAGLANIGQGIASVGEAIYQNEVTDDVTNVHVAMANTRSDWYSRLNEMQRTAKPSDAPLPDQVRDGLQKSFEDMSASFKTRQGQQTFARMSAAMTNEIQQQAISMQSHLDGQFAKNSYINIRDKLGGIAAQDHTQWKSLIDQGNAMIDDPNSQFGRIPQSTKDEFKKEFSDSIKFEAARGFARKYPNAVLDQIPSELRNVTRDVAANPPVAGQIPNLNADTVKPYTPQNVDALAKKITDYSPYDAAFEAAAKRYNLDPRELKLRAVVESGLDPNAKSAQGAIGIMQMTPETAARYGANPASPTDAIMAAAKLLSDYRTKAGGDMSKVDMMYYGGEGGTQWGPNTKQYAANLAALRQTVGLGTSKPPEGFAENPVDQVGQSQNWKQSKTGIDFIDSLPPEQYFHILTEAEHYSRAAETESERSRLETERKKKEVADATMGEFLTRIIDPKPENGGPLTEREIVGNQNLTWEQRQHAIDYKFRREQEMNSREESKSNPAAVRELMLQIHAPDNDPTKTYNADAVMDAYKNKRISTNEMVFLRREVEQLRDGSTNPFMKDLQKARVTAEAMLTRTILGQSMPDVANEAAYRFDRDLEAKVQEYRAASKDPRTLLDPNSKDYVLSPERVKSFMSNGSTALNAAAAQVATKAAAAEGRVSAPGYAIGTMYQVNGKNMTYLGGPINRRSSWAE